MTRRNHGTGEPLLELEGITKRFPGVLANDQISFTLRRGEVLGLLGENGAGKSTLMHIVSGILTPDEGTIRVEGEPREFHSAMDAIEAGIGMVHQHFMLVPTLSVVENVVLGDPTVGGLRPRFPELAQKVQDIGESVGLSVDPHARVGALDIGDQQKVEIIKALYRDAGILILDEPTTVLTEQERENIFAMIRELVTSGVSVILISHKLNDIFAVCDRVVVLRDGGVVEDRDIGECTRSGLVESMVGEQIAFPERERQEETAGEALLEVDDLTLRRDNGSVALSGASFTLHAGEILAIAGVDGNGQRELAEALCGLRAPETGDIRYTTVEVPRGFRSAALRRAGIRHVPANRHAMGILGSASLVENHVLSHQYRSTFVRRGLLKRRNVRRAIAGVIDEYDVRTPSAEARMSSLSGGNQQKLVLGRELDGDSRILIAAHPTRGLDIRTVAFIQEKLLEKRREGLGILLISADLGEIWQVADRVMVLSHGKLYGPKPIADVDVQEVGSWMAAS